MIYTKHDVEKYNCTQKNKYRQIDQLADQSWVLESISLIVFISQSNSNCLREFLILLINKKTKDIVNR